MAQFITILFPAKLCVISDFKALTVIAFVSGDYSFRSKQIVTSFIYKRFI